LTVCDQSIAECDLDKTFDVFEKSDPVGGGGIVRDERRHLPWRSL
jgi:hypothetical protein